jgi:hypothetical protein
LRHDGYGVAEATPAGALMEHPEQVQQDDHENRHACQPENDVAKHRGLL